MTNLNVNTTFVADKIRKIRFCPEQLSENNSFVTGSSAVKFWKILKNDALDDEEMNEYTPKCAAKLSINGEVSGLEFIDYNNVVATNAEGLDVIYINRDREEDNLRCNFQMNGLHKLPCTDVSVLDEDLVTVGEDGWFNVISCVGKKVVRTNKTADSTAISCCSFVSTKELLTGNNIGVVKVFNVADSSDKPVVTLTASCEDEKQFNRVTSLCYHPTQIHIILAGTEEGSITIFDLRQPTMPASYLSAHADSINEINFHATEPTKLFTCSENGELWQWQQNTFSSNINGFSSENVDASSENPWLNGERAKSNINVTSMVNGSTLAINSFDSFKNKLIAAGDNEAIYIVEQLY